MLCPNCGESVLHPGLHCASWKPQDSNDFQCNRKPRDTRGQEAVNLNQNNQWTVCPAHLRELVTGGQFDVVNQHTHPSVEIHVLHAPYCDVCTMRGEGF
jgi:hypothetical protein